MSKLIASLLCFVAIGTSVGAQDLPVRYELLAASRIVDECVECDRQPFIRPLRGSLLLRQIPSFVCCIWEVLDVDVQDEEGEYILRGEGMYSTSDIGEPTQSMTLDLEVNGERVGLESSELPIGFQFPIIEIDLRQTSVPGDSVYQVTIFAVPQTAERTRYELVPMEELRQNSYVEIICPNCLVADPIVPLRGSFELLPMDLLNGDRFFAVENIDFAAQNASWDLTFQGSGSYLQTRAANPTQHMRLSVDVVPFSGRILQESFDGAISSRFPEIGITVDERLHGGLNYRSNILARPASKEEGAPYRRGDVNDDGNVDVSDAVSMFLWLFAGAEAPDCLAAANTNGDGRHDLSDGIYVLAHLFRGGAEPPSPGPVDCGTAPGGFS
ncbi:MAG: dockerin type I repeat-containing protein, partial [Planctomycetota bacterium]